MQGVETEAGALVQGPSPSQSWVDAHDLELYIVYDGLIGPLARLRIGPHRARAQAIADRLFQWAQIQDPAAHFEDMPFRIFAQFCKGISGLENHCIDGGRDFLDQFAMEAGDSQEERRRKHRALRKCYIERSILNQIYQRTHYRYICHRLELPYIEHLLRAYAPKENLMATLEGFELGIYPTSLRITNRIDDMHILLGTIEVYTHPRGSGAIEYTKLL